MNSRLTLLATLVLHLNGLLPLSGQQANAILKTVVIDAGHGGKDPGAILYGVNEKDITLSIALKLGKYIEDNISGIKVLYTRTTDEYLELHNRAEFANKNNADLFISIHANSNQNREVSGAETYVMGLHKSESNLDVARRENAVILTENDYSEKYEGFDPNSAESYIIFSIMQNTYLSQSIGFASSIQDQFRDRVHRYDRGVKQAGFLVLWKTAMPSVLIEVGYLSNKDEMTFLSSETGQDYIASAIYRAFKDYKLNIESRSNFNTAAPKKTAKNQSAAPVFPKYKPSAEKNKPDTILTGHYTIQIASSQSPLSINDPVFKGYSDIKEYKILDTYKYTIGNEKDFRKILALKNKILKDFPEAFIVASQNGKIITIQELIIPK